MTRLVTAAELAEAVAKSEKATQGEWYLSEHSGAIWAGLDNGGAALVGDVNTGDEDEAHIVQWSPAFCARVAETMAGMAAALNIARQMSNCVYNGQQSTDNWPRCQQVLIELLPRFDAVMSALARAQGAEAMSGMVCLSHSRPTCTDCYLRQLDHVKRLDEQLSDSRAREAALREALGEIEHESIVTQSWEKLAPKIRSAGKERCARRLAGEDLPPHLPCDRDKLK